MFDWGAQAVTAILNCGLHEARQKIQKRPWLYDGLEKWLEKLEVLLPLYFKHIKLIFLKELVTLLGLKI